ncbi:MAG: antiporter, family, partial [Candidatus Dependentiae bacterium]|nr:antiporter, family [Candidatus Dependentiae bacterium]
MGISSLWSVKSEFRLKVGLLALTFAFLTATQAIWRSLKVSVFAKIVGAAYVPDAKIYSLLLMIPIILCYSKLVDVLRRHQLMYVFTIMHSVGGFIFAYLLLHPTLGIANTIT